LFAFKPLAGEEEEEEYEGEEYEEDGGGGGDDDDGDVAASLDPVFLVTFTFMPFCLRVSTSTKEMYKKRTKVAVPTHFAAKIMRPRRGEGASLGAPTRIRLGCLFLDARFRAVWIVTRAVRPDVVRARPLDGERFVVVQVDLLLC